MSTRAVGVDIGGTKILGVAIDTSAPNDPIATMRATTPSGGRAIVEAVATVIHDLDDDPGTPVGVGVAGLVDRDGRVRTSPNLPGVEDFALRSELEHRLGRTVVVENDATAATVAEAAIGAGMRSDFLFVALGTGIGGGLVIDGVVVRGRDGFAGEFGHMIVDPGGVRCVCGRRGCWERYASGSALERLAAERPHADRWLTIGDGPVTAEQVIVAVRGGVAEARAVLDEWSDWVGLGIANLVVALDPERVVLGGGVLDAADLLLDGIRQATGRSLFGVDHRHDVDIVPAVLGSTAGATGAAMLAGTPTLLGSRGDEMGS